MNDIVDRLRAEGAREGKMRLNISSETSLSFDIEIDDKQYLLRMKGGDWELVQDGAVIKVIGQARIESFAALHRALDYLVHPF